MTDEGYTKFIVEWTDRAPLDDAAIFELDRWRKPLFDAGLIGHYADLGIGYGNLSVREPGTRRFIISGTQTGGAAHTDSRHYALVTDYDIDANRVSCRGASRASSETLTHAAIYELDASIAAVVHVHHRELWQHLKATAPTTAEDIAYGTPEMAREFRRLWRETDLSVCGAAAMGGHESGIVSFGKTLPEAARRVLGMRAERLPGTDCQEVSR